MDQYINVLIFCILSPTDHAISELNMLYILVDNHQRHLAPGPEFKEKYAMAQSVLNIIQLVEETAHDAHNATVDALSTQIAMKIAHSERDGELEYDIWLVNLISTRFERLSLIRNVLSAQEQNTRIEKLATEELDEETAVRLITEELPREETEVVAKRIQACDPGTLAVIGRLLAKRPALVPKWNQIIARITRSRA